MQAAIAAVHSEARTHQEVDWRGIVALYDRLRAMTPSPIIELNRAVAVSMADGPAVGLHLMDESANRRDLDRYHLLHSARAALLRRLDRPPEAADAYRRPLASATNPVDTRLLQRGLDEVTGEPI